MYNKKKLSIVIPTYNGAEFLSDTLNSIQSQERSDEIEVVVCDDLSTDETLEIAREFSRAKDNVKVYQNRQNLGMDRNFEMAVAHSTGEYFWFCGQDDVLEQGAISKILSVLQTKSAVDFVFVNYSQNSHDLSAVITAGMLEIRADTICTSAGEFFAATNSILPTFLPAFVMRKALWDGVDRTPFYGTQYVQVGTFLTLLPEMATYIVARPYVKGRIPDDGWQRDTAKFLDIFTGALEVLTFFRRNNPELISEDMYRKHFAFCWRNIFRAICHMRLEGLSLNEKIWRRVHRIFDPRYVLVIRMCSIMPSKFFSFAKRLGFRFA